MKTLTVTIFSLLSCCCFSQTAGGKAKLQFSSINTIGFSTGTSGETANLQTINGLRYKSWNVGIGTGIDWCGVKSVPLIADVRKTFSANKHKPFAYANAGVDFAWPKETDAYKYSNTNYKNGFTAETGVGYNIQLKNQTALVLSAGFGYKHQTYEQSYDYFIAIWPSPQNNQVTYDYYYRRIIIRAGIRL